MRIVTSPEEVQMLTAGWRCGRESIGFVPTMGALHAGHMELCQRARRENARFVASIFVNPLQFGPKEDLHKYPRPFERDCELLEAAGCDLLFAPLAEEMYVAGGHQHAGQPHSFVEVAALGDVWEGVARPGHMRGVATVVAKLFNIVGPNFAYFGEKDYQQLKVIQQMVRDLNFPIIIVPVPTLREADGLAMSSRNAYLAPDERAAAAALIRALRSGAEVAEKGERDVETIGQTIESICAAEPLMTVQYISIVHPDTLAPLRRLDELPQGRTARIIAAVRVGQTRLIDNIPIG